MAQQSSVGSDVVAIRLLQEQELQQVIVHELHRRKLAEHAAAVSHRFVLDHHSDSAKVNGDSCLVGHRNSVFSGVVGKSLISTDSSSGTLLTDRNGSSSLFSLAKSSASKQSKRKNKTNVNAKQLDRLQDTRLAAQCLSAVSVPCRPKKISPRIEQRGNMSSTLVSRKHVLSLNLVGLVSSPAPELRSTATPRAYLTDRHREDTYHSLTSFSSARSTRTAFSAPTPSKVQLCSIHNSKAPPNAENLSRSSAALGYGPTLALNSFPGSGHCVESDFSLKSLQRSNLPIFEGFKVSAIMGSSPSAGLAQKMHSLRSILVHPISCHVPAVAEHLASKHHTPVQDSCCIQGISENFEDWNALIAKYDSQILKPNDDKII